MPLAADAQSARGRGALKADSGRPLRGHRGVVDPADEDFTDGHAEEPAWTGNVSRRLLADRDRPELPASSVEALVDRALATGRQLPVADGVTRLPSRTADGPELCVEYLGALN